MSFPTIDEVWLTLEEQAEEQGLTLAELRDRHYARNDNQRSEISYLDIIRGGFQYQSDAASQFHRLNTNSDIGNEFNSKWIGNGKHKEYVFKYSHELGQFILVTSPLNLGTYNFESSEVGGVGGLNYFAHRAVDIFPWVVWGNSIEDAKNWTIAERYSAASEAENNFDALDWLGETAFKPLSVDYRLGRLGDDLMIADGDSEKFEGLSGFDTVSYSSSTRAVTVNLALGGFDGDARGDSFQSIEIILGSKLGDIIVGSEREESLFGNGGNDIISGGARTDKIYGGGGDDTLIGDAGNDTLIGGGGQNHFDGGAGDDTIDFGGNWGYLHFSGATAGIIIDKEKNIIFDGQGSVDTLVNIPLGSYTFDLTRFDDVFRGDTRGNFMGVSKGNDTFNGRSGVDTWNAHGATKAVIVNLSLSIDNAKDGLGYIDTLISVENVSGSAFSDRIFGSDSKNELFGNGGVDTLSGLGGVDFLYGGEDRDTLSGGDGDDILDGGESRDMLLGGSGKDTFVFLNAAEADGDNVLDFTVADGDRLDFSHFVGGVYEVETIDRGGGSYSILVTYPEGGGQNFGFRLFVIGDISAAEDLVIL